MKKPLSLLLVEDSEYDAFFLLRELEHANGYEVTCERVETSEAFAAALDSAPWDVVVSDYYVPGFGAVQALALLEEKSLDLPFIVVSGKSGEETAVEVMRAGARDYVMKRDLARLGPAIERELGEAKRRRERTKQLEALVEELRFNERVLRESEEHLKATFDQAAIGVAHVGLDGRWLRVNQKLCDITGYACEELLDLTFQDITHPDDLERDLGYVHRLLADDSPTYSTEKRYVRKDGSFVWINLTVSLMRKPSGEPKYFISMVEDVTERKATEEALRQSEERFRSLARYASDITVILDANGTIRYESPAVEWVLGFTPEERIGTNAFDHLHPDDARPVRNKFAELLENLDDERLSAEYRVRNKGGSWRHFEAIGRNLLHDPSIRGVVLNTRDVTERKRFEDGLRRSLGALLALYETGQTLASSLDFDEIGARLLKNVQRVSSLTTAIISVPDEDRGLRVWRSIGFDNLWTKARYAPEVQAGLQAALKIGDRRLLRLEHPEEDSEPLVGLCLPLRIKNRSVGLLEVYGSEKLLEDNATEILGSMASQAASALENARLYGELAEREKQLENLIGKLLRAQEEERRRIAYEVHDGLTQVATAAHQRLETFARRHPPASEKGDQDLNKILGLAQRTVGEARRVVSNLRPVVLDDFGLVVALNQEVEELRGDGWWVDYEEELGDERLPAVVETALFRVGQEALTNARKHAGARRAHLSLRRREDAIVLEVRDWGCGFDPDALNGNNGPGERVGISGMRERVGMLGGEFEISSRPGEGTLVTVRVPLSALAEEEERDES